MANHQADTSVQRADTHTAFAERVAKRFPTYRELQDAAKLAEQLQANPLWDVIDELISDRLESLSAALDGQVQATVQDYAHMHGTRQGLRWARDLPQTIRFVAARAAAAEEG